MSFAEEPPNKFLFDNATGVSLRAGNKRRRNDKHHAPIKPLSLSRMLSAEPLVDHDADAALWRIRESYSDAALASSGMWEQLQDPFEAKTLVDAAVRTIDEPIHFILNLNGSRWTQASLNLRTGSGA